MSRLLPVAAAVLLVAACGCGGTKAAPADPGRTVFGEFLDAAAAGDLRQMRSLLSPQSSFRLDDGAMRRLARTLRPLAHSHRLVVSERITDDFGVAAAAGRSGAYGTALRLVDEAWKLEVGGPIRIEPLGPDPGARERRVRQIAASITGASGSGLALLYLDGAVLPSAKVYRFLSKLSVVANLATDARPGRHSVVAFAGRGKAASARAWTFVVLPS